MCMRRLHTTGSTDSWKSRSKSNTDATTREHSSDTPSWLAQQMQIDNVSRVSLVIEEMAASVEWQELLTETLHFVDKLVHCLWI